MKMKKLLLLMMAGGLLTFASCQKNDPGINTGGQLTSVKISAVVPAQGFSTRGVALQMPDGFQLRYIMEVYTNDELVDHIAQFSPDFELRLITSFDYDFVLWADYVPDANGDATTNHHYNADDLTAISILTANYVNDASRDAFYCKETLTVDGSFATSFTLRRPFAQIRVKTNDLAAIGNAPSQQPTQVGISYTAGISTGFNAMTGTKTAVETSYPIVFGKQDIAVAPYSTTGETTADGWLAFDYIFADKDVNGLINFSLGVYNSTGALIMTNDKFINIPIQQNYRTNISGNLLTSSGSISIIIDPGFNDDDLNINLPELQTLTELQLILDAFTSANNNSIAYRVNVLDAPALNLDGTKLVNVPSILLSLTNGIGSGETLTINGGTYAGVIKINVGDSPLGTLIINAPNATVSIAGTIGQLDATTSTNTLLIGKGVYVGTLNLLCGHAEIFGTVDAFGTLGSDCKVFWGATDAASLKAAHKHANPNDGIILGANISGIDTEVFITRPGYLFDGRGFTLSGPVTVTGQAGQSSTSMINLIADCDNAIIKNVSITNTVGHGINIFSSVDVTVDNVSLINNKKAGMIVNGSTVKASNITSSGNTWYFANVAKGTNAPMTPHLTMSGTNNITDAVAIYSEGNACTYNGTIVPMGAKDASGWVSGFVPIQESFPITNLTGVGQYGGRFCYVWAPNGSTLPSSDNWGIDRFLSKSYALTASSVQTTIIPLSQTVASTDLFREWQGIKNYPQFATDVDSWSAETSLNVETGLTNTLQSFWVEVATSSESQVDWIAVAYSSNYLSDAYRGGPFPAGWIIYNSETGEWNQASGVSTSAGTYTLKISRSGRNTSVSVNGVSVYSYVATDTNTQTKPGSLLFNAKTYTNALTTTWSYPVVTGN